MAKLFVELEEGASMKPHTFMLLKLFVPWPRRVETMTCTGNVLNILLRKRRLRELGRVHTAPFEELVPYILKD
jgi:hypothetical protein